MKKTHYHRMARAVAAGLMTLFLGPTLVVGQSQPVSTETPVAEPAVHYIFFWKQDDAETRNRLQVFRDATAKLPVRSTTTIAHLDDTQHGPLVDHYGVRRAPMPLVLAVAPNGAVTKAWPTQFTAAQLHEGIVSPNTADTLKALQDKKLVVLCVLNRRTPSSQANLQNALSLQSDPRFANASHVVALDAEDSREADFLRQLQVEPGTVEPVIIVLAPPGEQLAKLTGHVTTEQLVSKLVAAQAACCPGGKCGPNGQCCPGGQCPPQAKR